MAYEYSKPISIAIFFVVIISATGRPSEKHARNTGVENADAIQVLELNESPNGESQNSSDSNLEKLIYNVSQTELSIPVRVIYDSTVSSTDTAIATNNLNNKNRTSSETKTRRNSRILNISEMDENAKENDVELYLSDDDDDDDEDVRFSHQPLAGGESKSSNRTKNPFAALILTGPEFLQPSNSSTSKKVPVLYHLFSPTTKNKHNDTVIERIDHKYLIPILEKLKHIMNKHALGHHHHHQHHIASAIGSPSPLHFLHPFKKPVRNPAVAPITPTYQTDGYVPSPYPSTPYPIPQFHPYDIYRQWNPYPYYPIMGQDPLHAMYHNYLDQDYVAPPREICYGQHRMAKMNNQQPDEDGEVKEGVTEVANGGVVEEGKRRYDEDTSIEYVDRPRIKRQSADRKKVAQKSKDGEIRRWHLTNDKNNSNNKEDAANKSRGGSDVGPQISKLIVRRGGVAIAGAGGIATAGSGGTAIVGPGGTAFTTPASSGGVAMVGPGGKVINMPDMTSVMYGRQTANVAATGAGHTTFTNKNGEVFTTSDNTGGVALVNPAGGIMGFSDTENFLDNALPSDRKEVQVPAGARLLTTGPIIYYNPVYPHHQL